MSARFRLSEDEARAEVEHADCHLQGEAHFWRRSLEAEQARFAARGLDPRGYPLPAPSPEEEGT